MSRDTHWEWGVKGASFGAGFAAILIAAGATFSDAGEADKTVSRGGVHTVISPDTTTLSGDCLAEAAAYSSAIDVLNLASAAADDAYEAWYDCEMSGEQPPESEEELRERILASTVSILD